MEVFTSRPVGDSMVFTSGQHQQLDADGAPCSWDGRILFRSRLTADLFTGLHPGSTRAGRWLHANVIGCGIFAAVSAAARPPAPPSQDHLAGS